MGALPIAYRDFLTNVNGREPWDSSIWIRPNGGSEETSISFLDPRPDAPRYVANALADTVVGWTRDDWGMGIPTGMVTIGKDGGGNPFLLRKDTGEIYVHFRPDPEMGGTLVADSFDELLAQIGSE